MRARRSTDRTRFLFRFLFLFRLKQPPEAKRSGDLEQPGHRSDIRAVSVSADDSLLLSTSQSGAKIWNPRTGACLRSVEGSGYGLCCAFVPGNRHALVGTKGGALEFIDVAAASVARSVAAHSAPLWSIALQPDGEGFVTGGADKEANLRPKSSPPTPPPPS